MIITVELCHLMFPCNSTIQQNNHIAITVSSARICRAVRDLTLNRCILGKVKSWFSMWSVAPLILSERYRIGSDDTRNVVLNVI